MMKRAGVTPQVIEREAISFDDVLRATPQPTLLDRVLEAEPHREPFRPFVVEFMPVGMRLVRGQFFNQMAIDCQDVIYDSCYFYGCWRGNAQSNCMFIGCVEEPI